jgi:hypothetical protein
MKRLDLRLPDELHERLVRAAQHDMRSLNAEILWLLSEALDRAEVRIQPRDDRAKDA